MSNLFNRLAMVSLLILVPIATTGLSYADQKPLVGYVQEKEQVSSEAAVPPLAMNDADTLAAAKKEKSISESAPVILVPMVLAVLALVAVSRRKES